MGILTGFILAASLSNAAVEQDSLPRPVERFQLFNECRQMVLSVAELSGDAEDIDLSVQRIETMAESRLRAARLYTDNASVNSAIQVNVNINGPAYGIAIQYYKVLSDETTGVPGAAVTWQEIAIGTHGGDAGHILQYTSEYLDRFILEYLRVNEGACGQ